MEVQSEEGCATICEKPLKDEARTKNTLSYINLHACNLHTPHPAWQVGAVDPLTVMNAITKEKLLTQCCPLYYNRTGPILHSIEQSEDHHNGNLLRPTLQEEHPPRLYIQICQHLEEQT